MFQKKSQLVLKRLVACIYLWTALNRTILFSIFKLKLPHRIISILNGWKTLTVSLKTCRSSVNFLQWKKKWMASSIIPHKSHKGLSRRWFLKRSLLRLLQLFRSRACNIEIYLFPIVKWEGTHELFKLEVICFLKVCNVDRFFKSSSREFQSLMEEGIHDFCEILVLLKGTDIFLLFSEGNLKFH